VEEVLAAAKERFAVTLEEIVVTRETVEFKLPKALSAPA
jgi:4-hydroxy-3-methylbut-2-en-1-yl diphosphate reductase